MRSVYDIKHADDPDVATIIILPPPGRSAKYSKYYDQRICMSVNSQLSKLSDFFYFLRVAVSVYGGSAIQNILYKLM